jgi:hypothetical protein
MRYPAAALLTAIAIMPLGEAAAARLDKEACQALKAEQARLIDGGTKADMERGPDWAKATLAPDRLKRIERLLEVEEGLAFRCPQSRPAPAEAEAKSDPAAAPARRSANGETEPGKPAGAETPAAAQAIPSVPAGAGAMPKPNRAAAAKGGPEAGVAKPQAATPAAPAKSAPAPKRKAQKPAANDAYSPPSGTGSTLKLPSDAEDAPWKKECARPGAPRCRFDRGGARWPAPSRSCMTRARSNSRQLQVRAWPPFFLSST